MRGSEAWVDGLRFKGENSEYCFVDPPQRLASYQSADGFEADDVLAKCE